MGGDIKVNRERMKLVKRQFGRMEWSGVRVQVSVFFDWVKECFSGGFII